MKKNNQKKNQYKNKNNKKLSREEKMNLARKIQHLNKNDLKGLSQILAKIKSKIKVTNDGEIEFNIENLPNHVLKEMCDFVEECLKEQREKELKELNINVSSKNQINTTNKKNYTNSNFTSHLNLNNFELKNKSEKSLLGLKRNKCVKDDSIDLSKSSRISISYKAFSTIIYKFYFNFKTI